MHPLVDWYLSRLLAQAEVERVEVTKTDVVPVAMTVYGDLLVDLHVYVDVRLRPRATMINFTVST